MIQTTTVATRIGRYELKSRDFLLSVGSVAKGKAILKNFAENTENPVGFESVGNERVQMWHLHVPDTVAHIHHGGFRTTSMTPSGYPVRDSCADSHGFQYVLELPAVSRDGNSEEYVPSDRLCKNLFVDRALVDVKSVKAVVLQISFKNWLQSVAGTEATLRKERTGMESTLLEHVPFLFDNVEAAKILDRNMRDIERDYESYTTGILQDDRGADNRHERLTDAGFDYHVKRRKQREKNIEFARESGDEDTRAIIDALQSLFIYLAAGGFEPGGAPDATSAFGSNEVVFASVVEQFIVELNEGRDRDVGAGARERRLRVWKMVSVLADIRNVRSVDPGIRGDHEKLALNLTEAPGFPRALFRASGKKSSEETSRETSVPETPSTSNKGHPATEGIVLTQERGTAYPWTEFNFVRPANSWDRAAVVTAEEACAGRGEPGGKWLTPPGVSMTSTPRAPSVVPLKAVAKLSEESGAEGGGSTHASIPRTPCRLRRSEWTLRNNLPDSDETATPGRPADQPQDDGAMSVLQKWSTASASMAIPRPLMVPHLVEARAPDKKLSASCEQSREAVPERIASSLNRSGPEDANTREKFELFEYPDGSIKPGFGSRSQQLYSRSMCLIGERSGIFDPQNPLRYICSDEMSTPPVSSDGLTADFLACHLTKTYDALRHLGAAYQIGLHKTGARWTDVQYRFTRGTFTQVWDSAVASGLVKPETGRFKTALASSMDDMASPRQPSLSGPVGADAPKKNDDTQKIVSSFFVSVIRDLGNPFRIERLLDKIAKLQGDALLNIVKNPPPPIGGLRVAPKDLREIAEKIKGTANKLLCKTTPEAVSSDVQQLHRAFALLKGAVYDKCPILKAYAKLEDQIASEKQDIWDWPVGLHWLRKVYDGSLIEHDNVGNKKIIEFDLDTCPREQNLRDMINGSFEGLEDDEIDDAPLGSKLADMISSGISARERERLTRPKHNLVTMMRQEMGRYLKSEPYGRDLISMFEMLDSLDSRRASGNATESERRIPQMIGKTGSYVRSAEISLRDWINFRVEMFQRSLAAKPTEQDPQHEPDTAEDCRNIPNLRLCIAGTHVIEGPQGIMELTIYETRKDSATSGQYRIGLQLVSQPLEEQVLIRDPRKSVDELNTLQKITIDGGLNSVLLGIMYCLRCFSPDGGYADQDSPQERRSGICSLK